MPTAKAQLIRGVTVGWIAHACGILVTFVCTPIIINGLGDEKYGIWSILMSLTGYYALADLGLGKATAKYLAQFVALGDRERVRRILATTVHSYLWLSSALGLVSIAFAILFPMLFGAAGMSRVAIAILVLFTGLRVAAQLLGTTFRSALVAQRRFDLTNVMGIISQISSAACMVLIISIGGDLPAMAIVLFIVGALLEIATWKMAVYKLKLPSFRLRDADGETRQMMFSFGLLTVAANTSQQLSRNSSSIIGGLIAGPTAVAYFSVAESLTQKLHALGKPIGQAAMPAASQLQAEERKAMLIVLTEQALRILIALALAFICVIWVFGFEFVRHWIGIEFAEKSYPMLLVLSLALAVNLPGSSVMQILQGLGQVGFTARVAIVEGLVVVLVGVPLTYFWGMLGMSCTLLLTTLTFQGVVQGGYLLRTVGISLPRFFSSCILPAVASAMPAFGFALLARSLTDWTNLMVVLLQMAATLSVAATAMFFTCLSAETRGAAIAALFGRYFAGSFKQLVRKSSRDDISAGV